MNSIKIISIVFILGFINSENDCKISHIKINDKKIELTYENCVKSNESFKIEGLNNYPYFIKDDRIIYFKTDTIPVPSIDIGSLIRNYYVRPDTVFSHNPSASLFFFIDKQGEVRDYGILRGDLEPTFNRITLDLGATIVNKVKFSPAKIGNNEVESFFIIGIFFSNLTSFQKQLDLSNR